MAEHVIMEHLFHEEHGGTPSVYSIVVGIPVIESTPTGVLDKDGVMGMKDTLTAYNGIEDFLFATKDKKWNDKTAAKQVVAVKEALAKR